MKHLLLLLTLVVSLCANSQVRIASPKEQIKAEFGYLYIEDHMVSDSVDAITFQTRKSVVTHLFNEAGISYCAFLTPLGDAELKYYIERYNSQYIVLSPTQWRLYANDQYVDITLTTSNSKHLFIWQ
jgi:hypothetical protein